MSAMLIYHKIKTFMKFKSEKKNMSVDEPMVLRKLYLFCRQNMVFDLLTIRVLETNWSDGAQHIQRFLRPHKLWCFDLLAQNCGTLIISVITLNTVKLPTLLIHSQIQIGDERVLSIECSRFPIQMLTGENVHASPVRLQWVTDSN